ncbi:MAG: tetratricopeptide repeat protein [Cyanosarcina radialis HA8281-LM2]|jgi:tetratricopeptide (TPR) repeat protein|nr:tetratricopeptide repeat protein [Cyanosarcina radialis HA8281-LM2]
MTKLLRLTVTLSAIFVPTVIILGSPIFAKENPLCVMVTPTNRIVNLNHICGANQNQKLQMNAQHFYQQGRINGKKELYKEAIADFTQAINLKPDFIEAYVMRAAVRHYGEEDTKQAIEDLQQAANICKQKGQLERAKLVYRVIESYQNDSE